MRTCVIFNPSAKGDKARHFRRHLDAISHECAIKPTSAVGEARRLAAGAVKEGFEIIVAAGGDGTINEVLNGIGDVPDGFERARLAVLPLGTVNVFAQELGIPSKLEAAWTVIHNARELRIDLPVVEYCSLGDQQQRSASLTHRLEAGSGVTANPTFQERRFFAQLAGAGLDARAVQLVNWGMKKRIGSLAYILAGLHALMLGQTKITAEGAGHKESGELILIGNGRLYGGQFTLFPGADLQDGLLEVCVLPHADWLTLIRCSPALLLLGRLPASASKLFRTEYLTLTGDSAVPLQIDGELIGLLPARLSVERSRLRVIVP